MSQNGAMTKEYSHDFVGFLVFLKLFIVFFCCKVQFLLYCVRFLLFQYLA